MSITLNSKVYNWAQYDQSGTSRYLETSGGVPSSFSNLTARVRVGTGDAVKRGGKVVPSAQRVQWRLTVPIVATEASACACDGEVLRTTYVDVITDIPATSTAAERTDVLTRLQQLVTKPEFAASFTALTQPSA